MEGGLRDCLRDYQIALFQSFFYEVLRAKWTVPGYGSLLTSFAKKFCILAEATIENFKVPRVDAPVVALPSGAVLSKDRDSVLKDSVDRKNEVELKKLHEASSLTIRASAIHSYLGQQTA